MAAATALRSLAGKVAVVTGSTSGIGLGAARVLASRGASIVLNGFGDKAEIAALCSSLQAEHDVAVTFDDADLMNPNEAAGLVHRAQEAHGAVDVLVNNAGIQHVSPVHEFPTDAWDRIIALNLSACFHTTRAALPGMYERGFGRVINVASVRGLVASKDKSAYVAAKHGLVGFTKTVALEAAGTGVTANCVCPGWVLTPLVQKQVDARAEQSGLSNDEAGAALLAEKQPSRQFVTPEHLGELMAFLASDAAAHTTGVAIPMDGGWTAQ